MATLGSEIYSLTITCYCVPVSNKAFGLILIQRLPIFYHTLEKLSYNQCVFLEAGLIGDVSPACERAPAGGLGGRPDGFFMEVTKFPAV